MKPVPLSARRAHAVQAAAPPVQTGLLRMKSPGPPGQSAPREIAVRVRPTRQLQGLEDHPWEVMVSAPVRDGECACEIPAGRVDVRLQGAAVIPVYRWGLLVKPGESEDLGAIELRRGAAITGWVRTPEEKVLTHSVLVSLMPQSVGHLDGRARPQAAAVDDSGGQLPALGLLPLRGRAARPLHHRRRRARPPRGARRPRRRRRRPARSSCPIRYGSSLRCVSTSGSIPSGLPAASPGSWSWDPTTRRGRAGPWSESSAACLPRGSARSRTCPRATTSCGCTTSRAGSGAPARSTWGPGRSRWT